MRWGVAPDASYHEVTLPWGRVAEHADALLIPPLLERKLARRTYPAGLFDGDDAPIQTSTLANFKSRFVPLDAAKIRLLLDEQELVGEREEVGHGEVGGPIEPVDEGREGTEPLERGADGLGLLLAKQGERARGLVHIDAACRHDEAKACASAAAVYSGLPSAINGLNAAIEVFDTLPAQATPAAPGSA